MSDNLSAAELEFLAFLAFAYLEHDLVEDAVKLMEAGTLLFPNEAVLWRNLALGHLKSGDGRTALDAVRRYMHLSGDDAPGSTLRILESRALMQAGRDEEAREVFNRFVDERLARAD